METYEELVAEGRKAADMQWTLGDLALKVETHYAEHSLESYAGEIGVEYAAMRAYKAVSQAYESVIRITDVPWTVYRLLMAQDDRAELIKKVKTVAEARSIVAARKALNDPTPPRPTTTGHPRPTSFPDEPKHAGLDYQALWEDEKEKNKDLSRTIDELNADNARLLHSLSSARFGHTAGTNGVLSDLSEKHQKMLAKAIATDSDTEARTYFDMVRDIWRKSYTKRTTTVR